MAEGTVLKSVIEKIFDGVPTSGSPSNHVFDKQVTDYDLIIITINWYQITTNSIAIPVREWPGDQNIVIRLYDGSGHSITISNRTNTGFTAIANQTDRPGIRIYGCKF